MSSKREKLRRVEEKLRRQYGLVTVSQLTETIPYGPVEFCRKTLKFEPTGYQRKFLEDAGQFVALRWCRQSGKTFIVAAKILWFLLRNPSNHVGVIAPSFRQSKLIIRKISAFLPRIPKPLIRRVLKVKIEFSNGSCVEAFPNNPETIRGPTLDGIYCDEMNFIRDDEEIYDATLFTLGTTNGWFICSSTPWARDSLFYRISNDPEYSDFSRHHVTWREAVEPNGPLSREILEKIRKQFQADLWRWRREMEAEWAEDEDVWLPQKLIVSCQDPELQYIDERILISGD